MLVVDTQLLGSVLIGRIMKACSTRAVGMLQPHKLVKHVQGRHLHLHDPHMLLEN